MVEGLDVRTISQQIKTRIAEVERELARYGDLTDELERLREALRRLEDVAGGGAGRGRRAANGGVPAGRGRGSSGAVKRSAATRARRRQPVAARGQVRATILAALEDGPKTAGEIAAATGIKRPSASTTLTKLAKGGEVVKAARGYALPE